MMLKTPLSLKAEHDELHAQLGQAIEAGGATGEAAAKVAKALHLHFLKEEEYALPPLGLLPALAEAGSCRRWRRLWPWPIALRLISDRCSWSIGRSWPP